jgi:hypothetical protein
VGIQSAAAAIVAMVAVLMGAIDIALLASITAATGTAIVIASRPEAKRS